MDKNKQLLLGSITAVAGSIFSYYLWFSMNNLVRTVVFAIVFYALYYALRIPFAKSHANDEGSRNKNSVENAISYIVPIGMALIIAMALFIIISKLVN